MQKIRRFRANRDLDILWKKDEIFEEFFNKPNIFYPVREGFFDNKLSNHQTGIFLLSYEDDYKIMSNGTFTELEPLDAKESAYYKFYAGEWLNTMQIIEANLLKYDKAVAQKRQEICDEIAMYESLLRQ